MFDPCRLCEFVRNIWTIVIVFVLCGYIGKGIYLFGGKDDVVLANELKNPAFYRPDGTFIIMGVTLFVLLIIATMLLKVLFTQVLKCSKGACFCLFSKVICRCCFDEEKAIISEGTKYSKLDKHEMADIIIGDDNDTSKSS
jgi:hypothetical protein